MRSFCATVYILSLIEGLNAGLPVAYRKGICCCSATAEAASSTMVSPASETPYITHIYM